MIAGAALRGDLGGVARDCGALAAAVGDALAEAAGDALRGAAGVLAVGADDGADEVGAPTAGATLSDAPAPSHHAIPAAVAETSTTAALTAIHGTRRGAALGADRVTVVGVSGDRAGVGTTGRSSVRRWIFTPVGVFGTSAAREGSGSDASGTVPPGPETGTSTRAEGGGVGCSPRGIAAGGV